MTLQVLQVLEQLLKSGDNLLASDHKDLPATSYAGAFLKDLGKQLTSDPDPGQIIK